MPARVSRPARSAFAVAALLAGSSLNAAPARPVAQVSEALRTAAPARPLAQVSEALRTAAPARPVAQVSKALRTAAAPDPSLPGPYGVATVEVLEGEHGATTNFDLYLPPTAGVYPGIVLAHGFSQYKDYQEDNARHLASWGFVVLTPTFSTFADELANAVEMLDLASWLTGDQNPYRESVDASRLGLAGHSAGGLSTFIAAGMDGNGDQRISAVVTLDPVDLEGSPYAEVITAPTLTLVGIPYACNSDGNGERLHDALPDSTDQMFLRLTHAVHCDFNTQGIDHACSPGMDPARPAKIARLLLTQGWAPAYDAATAGVCAVDGMEEDRADEINLVEKYLAAWFLARLQDQAWADDYLYDGPKVQEDLAAGVVQDLKL